MGAITYDMEVTSSIPPAKMFKAFVLDGDTLIPKVLPQAIKSVETLQEDGRAGTIKLTTFGEDSKHKCVKHKVDAVDKENFTYSYSIIEGDALDGFEFISYHIKIVVSYPLPMEDPSARTGASTAPKVITRSQRRKSSLARRRLQSSSRLLRPTSWQILIAKQMLSSRIPS
ncbi:hypothetical protein RHMOL_Rhmol04G0364900 [Rhododendron molle]|uniref:Uncharacterized protein n=1 Tax=Rhododendron molle TaxID=49168 RepID=A0ACC0P9M6_RHOML|nr:hypothetical protein RHMOL_Rhmol04G0364900 [Rhododendron molle]